MLRCVALVRTDISEGPSASFIRVTRIGELGTTQAATNRRQVPPKRRLLQESHGVTSQKTPFFIVTAVKTSNLTKIVQISTISVFFPRVLDVRKLLTNSMRRLFLEKPTVAHLSSDHSPILITLTADASVVPSSQIIVTLMKEALRSSAKTVLTRATRRNIQEGTIPHIHLRENFKSYN
jgi:hypothetical protein